MSCYFRQLNEIFAKAGINVTPGNRKQIDKLIHQLVGTNYKDCPGTWRKLKQEIMLDDKKRQEFIVKLRNAVK